jgi:HTH-type transcriptional regulator/antitoxin HigA
LLSTLIEVYESKHYHFESSSPIDAIAYRMEEQGLQQKDLIPYIGSKSKVSEVLSGKRPLTITMIKSLHDGLKIPLEVLLSEQSRQKERPQCKELTWDLFPLKEIINRKWVSVSDDLNILKDGPNIYNKFISQLGSSVPCIAMYRKGDEGNEYSLLAWVYQIAIRANKETSLSSYQEGTIDKGFLRELIRLSWFDNGPALAKEFLNKYGIAIIVESHLPGTKVDGVSFFHENRPVVGLSLRYDRLDSFWFTLIHELIHICTHIKNPNEVFVDDLDAENETACEKEANRLTRETLIPRSIWLRSEALHERTPSAIKILAEKLRVHPSIVAGRLRYELKNYQIFTDMIGQGEVGKFFHIPTPR